MAYFKIKDEFREPTADGFSRIERRYTVTEEHEPDKRGNVLNVTIPDIGYETEDKAIIEMLRKHPAVEEVKSQKEQDELRGEANVDLLVDPKLSDTSLADTTKLDPVDNENTLVIKTDEVDPSTSDASVSVKSSTTKGGKVGDAEKPKTTESNTPGETPAK